MRRRQTFVLAPLSVCKSRRRGGLVAKRGANPDCQKKLAVLEEVEKKKHWKKIFACGLWSRSRTGVAGRVSRPGSVELKGYPHYKHLLVP
eukprot:scaffold1068_cov167-Amphora_coffeaeformis.AAC.6